MMMNIQYHNQRCVHYVLIVTQWFIEKKVLDVEELKKNLNIKKQVYIILCIAVQMCNNCYRKGHYFLFIMLSS